MQEFTPNKDGIYALIDALDGRYTRPDVERRCRVISVPKGNDGLALFAYVQIDNEGSVIKAALDGGEGGEALPGEEWITGRPAGQYVDPGWKLLRRASPLTGNRSDRKDVDIYIPIVPAATFGGYMTGEGRSSASDPGGPTLADIWVFPRSTVSGTMSIYDSRKITGFVYQLRKQGDVEWSASVFVVSYPPRPIRIKTSSSILADTLVIPVTVDASTQDHLLEDQPAYWRIGDEIILGRYDAGSSAIHVTWYVGPGDAEQGFGFADDAQGREQENTTAKAWPSGTTVELQSAQFRIQDLQPDTYYQLRVAHVTELNRQSEWCPLITFHSWKKTAAPPAPGSVTVDQQQAVLETRWTKIGQNDVNLYKVWRYDHVANGGITPAATTGPTPIAGATLVAQLDGTFYPVPIGNGSGNYIGVQGRNDSGVDGDIRWNVDNTPPPHPNPAHWTLSADSNGKLMAVLLPAFYAAGSGSDKGFVGVRAYRASAPVAGIAGPPPNTNVQLTKVAEAGRVHSFEIPDDASTLDYYQLSARDWAGNESVIDADAGYWKRDDQAPNAPAGFSSGAGSVVALQSVFRVRWTLPPAADLAKIKQWRIDRATAGPLGIESRYVDAGTNVFNWSSHDYTTLPVAGALYFRVTGIGWNGVAGTSTAWANDITAPAPPAPANQYIRSDLGGVYVQISPAENPQADDGWREYVLLQALDTFGNGSTPVAWFNSRQIKREFDVWDSKFFQVVSGDWVGNYGVGVPGAWVQARSLYPVDPRFGMPANGDFQTLDPASGTRPLYWSTNTFQHTNGMSVGEFRVNTWTYDQAGGHLGSAAMRATTGPDILVNYDSNLPTLRTSTRMYIDSSDTKVLTFWIKLPYSQAAGQITSVTLSYLIYANPSGGTLLAENYQYVVLSGARTAGVWYPLSVATPFATAPGRYVELSVISIGGTLVTASQNFSFDDFNLVNP